MSGIEFRGLSFAYPDGAHALTDVDLAVEAGEILLVIGDSGSGKSTLLRAVNGLVPHASGGTFGGEVVVGVVSAPALGRRWWAARSISRW